MSKIIGATVGTPISTSKIKSKIESEIEGKLDKVTTITSRHQLYGKDYQGGQVMYNVGHYNNSGNVVMYAPAENTTEVGAYDYGGTIAVSTPQQKYQAANKLYVDNAIGDIEEALDKIIEIQEGYTKAIFTFTVEDYSTGGEPIITECKCDIGMTWAEWVNSEYNTVGAYMSDDGMVACGSNRGYLYDNTNSFAWTAEQEPIEGETYWCS